MILPNMQCDGIEEGNRYSNKSNVYKEFITPDGQQDLVVSKYTLNNEKNAIVSGNVAQDRVQLLYNNADFMIDRFLFFSFKQQS